MDHLRFGVFPVPFPFGREVLGRRDVADRCIEPHIEHFAFGPLDRHGDAPVQVAAHGARLQSPVEPAFALAIDVGFPLFVSVENPLAQESFVSIQRQIPVFCLPLHRHRARDGAVGVDQFVGRKGRTALLALVAVSPLVAAAGTGAHDVAVGEKGVGLLVVILLGRAFDEFARVIERAEELRGGAGMGGRGRAGVDVERNTQPAE